MPISICTVFSVEIETTTKREGIAYNPLLFSLLIINNFLFYRPKTTKIP